MIVSLRCDCAFFLEKLEIIMCRLWRPECVARHLSSKLTAHLQRIDRTDLIPYIQYDTKHGKGGI